MVTPVLNKITSNSILAKNHSVKSPKKVNVLHTILEEKINHEKIRAKADSGASYHC